MAAKKKAVRRARKSEVQRAADRLGKTWDETRAALGSAESKVEKRVRAFVRKSGLDTEKATEMLMAVRHRLEGERRRAMKKLETEVASLQSRVKKERRAVGRMVDEAVQGALAALNIPSRHEVHELTRRVEDLSRRIDSFRRAPARPKTRAAARANA